MLFDSLKNYLQQLLVILVIASSCLFANHVWAFDRNDSYTDRGHQDQSYSKQNHRESTWEEYNDWNQHQSTDHYRPRNEIRSQPKLDRWAQNDRRNYRSKSDVINEVKRRYDARVLKIHLNEQRAVYKVRILMPSGKIRNIQVSALR